MSSVEKTKNSIFCQNIDDQAVTYVIQCQITEVRNSQSIKAKLAKDDLLNWKMLSYNGAQKKLTDLHHFGVCFSRLKKTMSFLTSLQQLVHEASSSLANIRIGESARKVFSGLSQVS